MSEAQDKRKKEKKTRLCPIKSSRRVTTRLYGQRIPHILADIRKRKLFPTLILTFKLGKIKEFYRNHEMVNVTVNDKVPRFTAASSQGLPFLRCRSGFGSLKLNLLMHYW